MSFARLAAALVLAAVAVAAAAQQQFYRWTDERGRTHVTDTPPPPGTKDVRRVTPGAVPRPTTDAQQPQVPMVLQHAMKDYPVTLYSSPNCGDPCATARDLLNKRGVPFTEKQVWEEEGNEELKKLSGKNQVPALKVGNTVQSGFERSAYSALLDSAGYPREGVLPARAQAAPGRPEGYIPPGEREVPKAEPVRPAETAPAAAGPYAPGAPPQRRK
jgi:glutaredoxin